MTSPAATRLIPVVIPSSPRRRRTRRTFTRQNTQITVKLSANPSAWLATADSARACRLVHASAGGASTFAMSSVAANP